MENFVTFWKFNSIEESKELTDALDQNQIHYIIEDDSPDVDLTFTGNELEKEFHVKIDKNDFNKAYEILEDLSVNNVPIDDKDKDYYLFEFTDDELMEILQKYDEWNTYDYKLAQRILKERGKEVSKIRLDQFKKDRIEFLKQTKSGNMGGIAFGFISSLLGGFLGIIIGWHHLSSKTLPNGEKAYIFDEHTRKLGRILLYVGLFFFIAEIILLILRYIL